MEGKSSTESERLFYADLPIDNVRLERTFSNVESFISPNYSKFAKECERSSKISPIRTFELFLIKERWDFFAKKLGFFSKSVKVANLL